MKKRMLALLLTLCMVISLMPAQAVVAEGEAANVTIVGNGSSFVLYQNGEPVTGLVQEAFVYVPENSTLRQEGYTIEGWDRDTQYLTGWSVNGQELDGTDMLDVAIPAGGTTVFVAGWIGEGGGEDAVPTAIAFKNGGYIAYIDGVLPVVELVCTPSDAVIDQNAIELTVDDPSVATVTGLFVNPVSAGETTIRAKYGDLTAEGRLEIREFAPLELDMARTFSTYSSNVYYTFTPDESGEYGFTVSGGTALFVQLTDPNASFDDPEAFQQIKWYPAAGEALEQSVALEAGVTYQLTVSVEAATEVTALVTKNTGSNPNPDQGGTSNVLDLGAFPLGVPTAVQLPQGEDPSTGAALPGIAVATITPAADNWFVLYRSVPANGAYNGQQIRVYQGENYITEDYWYSAENLLSGQRWYLEAGKEYRIEFMGHTTDEGGITYTLKETVTPDSIYFEQETYEGYVTMGVSAMVCFKPIHGYGEVSYVVDDPSVAEVTSYGDVMLLQPGETTITATCGSLTASAKIVAKLPEGMKLGTPKTVSTGENARVRFSFAPDNDGEYTFLFAADETLWIGMWDDAHEFDENWRVEGGEDMPHTVSLKGGKVYTMDVSADYTNLDVTATVIANNQGGGDPTGTLLVALDGYHGDESYGGGKMTLPGDGGNPYVTGFFVWEWAAAGQTIAQVTGLSGMPDPKWDGFDFEGWLLYREDGDPFNGPSILTLENHNLLSTADLLSQTVPGYNIRYVAKWAQIDWEFYENIYDPYYGVNGGEVGGREDNVSIYANHGTYEFRDGPAGEYYTTEGYSTYVAEGSSLKDTGFDIKNPTYWTSRDFAGWQLTLAYPEYDENGDIFDWFFDEPEEGILTTAQLLDYKVQSEEVRHQFEAVWAGEESDYIAEIYFDGRGAEFIVKEEYGQWPTNGWSTELLKNGTTIGQQMQTTFGSVTGEADWGTFEGWLVCESDSDWMLYLMSDTVYTLDQIKAMKVDESITFVPKWSGVALEDYANVFGVYPPFYVEGAVVTDMKLDTKYDLAAEKLQYFTFTAPADGMYALNSDAFQGVNTELCLQIRNWGNEYIFDGRSACIQLEKGDTLEIKTQPAMACNLWVEEAVAVTKMEVVSQDKTPTYLKSEYLDPTATFGDVQLKMTFADGTTETISGAELWRQGMTYKSLPVGWNVEIGETTATVTIWCCDAEAKYTVNLDKATVVKMEVTPAADMFNHYENAMGELLYGPNGEFFCYYSPHFEYLGATYTFTWSDGTVENFYLDMSGDNDAHYHGVELQYHDHQFEKAWTVGKHTIDFYFGELTDSIEVELKANPVKSIKVLSMEPTQYTLGDPDYFVKAGNGWLLGAMTYDKYQLEVTYTDGTTKVLTKENETTFRDTVSLLDGMVLDGGWDFEKIHTAPGKMKAYMTLLDKEAEFEISIVEQAVVDGSASVSEATVDKMLEERKGNTVTLSVVVEDEVVTSVKLPVASVEKLMEEKVNHLVVELSTATVTLDEKALAAIAEQAEGATITLSIETTKVEDLSEKQQEALKNKNVEVVLTALVLSNGEPIGDFKGGSVKVKINFKPEKGYNYKVVYIADDGTTTDMVTEVSDDALAFWTGHFSDYVVVKEAVKAVNPEVPATGDHSNVLGLATMMAVSGAMAAALWLSLRKRNAA